MDQNSVRNTLHRANLALSPSMITKVLQFLKEHIGNTSERMQYEAFAALAIVGEVDQVRSVNSHKSVSSGIPLETVLRHSVGLSKESLLQVVTRQCMKWREAPVWLGTKIDSVKLSYRMHKKYRAVFEQLFPSNSPIERQRQFNLMAIFWIVFLFVKNRNVDQATAIDSTNILYCLFIFVFGEVVSQLDQQKIGDHFKRQFSSFRTPSPAEYHTYRTNMLNTLQSIHEWRHNDNSEIDLNNLSSNEHFIERFLDDISNRFDSFKLTMPKHSVDEITFLQLDKTLTPQSLARSLGAPQFAMTKKIDFFKDDDDQVNQQQPMQIQNPTSNRQAPFEVKNMEIPMGSGRSQRTDPASPMRQHNSDTPWRSRYHSLEWVNKITSRSEQKDHEDIKAIFEEGTSTPFAPYEEQALEKILASIKEFTPSCMSINKRLKSIYSFFAHFIKKIYEKHGQDERKSLFKTNTTFDAILCLAANLFNFAYQSLQSSYRRYCSIFGVSLMEGLLPINWFGLNVEMPKNIQGFLYDLEKKILIQQIWDDNGGYELLLGQKNYRGQALLKRLRLHADERAQQLCEAMKIEDKQITKVVNLVRFILEKRQILLREHKIDQIIVCSIGSILSINSSKTFSLEEIFNHYNKMLYSLNISRSIFFDNEGREVDLINYYNYVFLEQVEQIISDKEQAEKVLDTPIRLQRKKSLDSGDQLTPLSVKFKQVAIGAYGSKKLKRDGEDKTSVHFRNNIVHTLKNLHIKQQDEQNEHDDPPSPCFGMHRTLSFGDINQKF